MISSDRELDALERIQQSQNPVRQRDLARIIGLSLGMTNAILKRLAQKGLLQVQIAHRSYRYLKRTIKNVVFYKEAIDRLIQEIGSRGFRRLVLVGSSDLDFIVEHLCHKHHLVFERSTTSPAHAALTPDSGSSGVKDFVLYSENSRPPGVGSPNWASLRFLFKTQPPAPVAAGKLQPEEEG
jgi:hypothetical protein